MKNQQMSTRRIAPTAVPMIGPICEPSECDDAEEFEGVGTIAAEEPLEPDSDMVWVTVKPLIAVIWACTTDAVAVSRAGVLDTMNVDEGLIEDWGGKTID